MIFPKNPEKMSKNMKKSGFFPKKSLTDTQKCPIILV